MDDLRFDGRVAIVTGAGRGLGQAYASLLASRGAAVVVNDVGVGVDGSDPTSLVAEEAASAIRQRGGVAVADSNSVADATGAAAVIGTALDAFGRLDIVVNNAGVHVVQPFPQTTPECYELNVSVHLGGAYFMSQAAWPHLVAAGEARIVNTISSAVLGLPGLSAYGATKASIIGLTRALAAEGASAGVRANAISPSAVTRMVRDGQSALGLSDEEASKLSRIGTADYVASVVAVLAHHSCSISGEILYAGRGRIARVVLAETDGVHLEDPTPENVAASLQDILDASELTVLPDAVTQMARWSGSRRPTHDRVERSPRVCERRAHRRRHLQP